MNVLKQPWFWALLAGLALGGYVGYHAGVVTGYDHALDALKSVTTLPASVGS